MEENRVAFALDMPSIEDARRMALAVQGGIGMLKVGLELFVEAGPRAVAIGAEIERPVFLDLKLCDIPETVDRAVARACALGVRVLTVHASGGPAMLKRAAERAQKEASGLRVAAVTVLTSLDAGDLVKMGVGGDVATHARRLARLAFDEGVRVFVCSPQEAAALRADLGADATLITPGVRSAAAAGQDDQKRVMTAGDAVRAGADWVVVGRPIRDAADPLLAAQSIAREVDQARNARAGARGESSVGCSRCARRFARTARSSSASSSRRRDRRRPSSTRWHGSPRIRARPSSESRVPISTAWRRERVIKAPSRSRRSSACSR